MRKRQERQPDTFVHLMMAHQTRIYAYILGLVGNYSDADDIMQETTTVMWQKFSQFQPESDFVAWGLRIAQYKLKDLRKRRGREAKHLYSESLLEQLIPHITQRVHNSEALLERLRVCVGKLNERDAQLIHQRFYETQTPKVLAQQLGLTLHNVYKRLSRIQARLLDCVERAQQSEEALL